MRGLEPRTDIATSLLPATAIDCLPGRKKPGTNGRVRSIALPHFGSAATLARVRGQQMRDLIEEETHA
jgi:hypothetical protein